MGGYPSLKQSIPHLYPIILPLVPWTFWRYQMWLVPGPFWGGIPQSLAGGTPVPDREGIPVPGGEYPSTGSLRQFQLFCGKNSRPWMNEEKRLFHGHTKLALLPTLFCHVVAIFLFKLDIKVCMRIRFKMDMLYWTGFGTLVIRRVCENSILRSSGHMEYEMLH